MREIKFRAWDKKEKKMFYDDYQDTSGQEPFSISIRMNLKGQLVLYGHEDGGKEGLWEHELSRNEWRDRYKIMQSTGLKDKNGKEIYEGDVVKTQQDCRTPPTYTIDEVKPIEPMNGITFYGTCYPEKCTEVIGNIYETPELLEAK